MFRSQFAFFSLAAAAILLPCNAANAWLWGLFGGDKAEWRMMEPDAQDNMAAPFMQEAQTLQKNGEYKAAYKAYEEVWKKYPASKYAPEALFCMGKTSVLRQKWKKAFKAYNILVKSYPESEHFDEVMSDMFLIAESYEAGINIHYLWFIPYKDRTKAINGYETIVALAPYNDYAPICLTRIAMLHRNMRELAAAVDAMDRLINNYPNSMEAANATLLMAEYLSSQVQGADYDQGATHESMEYYKDFLTLYPNNPSVKYCEEQFQKNREQYAMSKFIIGEFFYKYRDDYNSAAVFFNDSITVDPNSEAAKASRDYLEKIALIKQHYPNDNWPRRIDWQFLMIWRTWDPLDFPEPAEKPAEKPAPEAPANATTTSDTGINSAS